MKAIVVKAIPEIATKVVREIVKDIIDRKGLGDEWTAIDPETQNEIEETWEEIVITEIRKGEG